MKKILGVVLEILRLPKVSINLNVDDSESEKLFHSFNNRHPRFPVIRRKTIGVMLLNLNNYTKIEDYLQTVSGKNSTAYYSRRCAKEGYEFRSFNPNDYQDRILEINNSQPERQGIKMSKSYSERLSYLTDEKNIYGGVFLHNELVAYIWFRVQGDLIIVNRILGHAEHLKKGVMYLLFSSAVNYVLQEKVAVKWMMYDTFFGAKEGLKLFKTRLGFKPYIVRWKK